jgi:hypothetical protein
MIRILTSVEIIKDNPASDYLRFKYNDNSYQEYLITASCTGVNFATICVSYSPSESAALASVSKISTIGLTTPLGVILLASLWQFAEELKFEQAADVRNQIKALKQGQFLS